MTLEKSTIAQGWAGDSERDSLHHRRRTLIIRTAARIFADKGYDRASIDDVADALKVSKPTIYYYLRSKENLLVEIVMLAIEQLDLVATSDKTTTGMERVQAFMRSYLDSLLDDLGRCMFSNIGLIRRLDGAKKIRAAQRQLHQRLYDAVTAGVSDGSIVSDDPALLTQMIFGAYHTIPLWYDAEKTLGPQEIHDRMMAIFRRGIEPSKKRQARIAADR
jgi:AcrR family transcriptional regulator